MIVVNLTPHDVVIYNAEGTQILTTIPRSGRVARVRTVRRALEPIQDIPVWSVTYEDVEGVPEKNNRDVYIVSLLVKQALPDRTDLYGVDSSPEGAVRDANGGIIGVKGLVR